MNAVEPNEVMNEDVREPLSELLVVDTDVHLHESPEALAPYCEMPWKVAVESLIGVPERYLDLPGFSPGTSAFQARFPTAHERSRKVTTPDQMRKELTNIQVDIGILFPDHLLKIAMLTQSEYAAALARAYNAWLVDQWTAPDKGLLGLLVACPQDPASTAREIERYANHPGIVGVYLPCAGLDIMWGHRKYDPIYEAAQAANFPLLLHSVLVTHPAFPFNNQGFDTNFGRHVTAHTFSVMANVTHMVETGVVVRYPDLKLCATEAGISWVPFLWWKLDKEYVERRRDVPFLKERPSHYLKNFYICTQPIEEPEDLSDLVKMVELINGEDTVVFASDWPHHDFDHPMKLDQVPFSNELRRKVLGENALRLFNIDRAGRRLGIS
jgi:hypothetical protein